MTFLRALAMAPGDDHVREQLADGFRRTRTAVADLLGISDDAAQLAVAMFNGALFHSLLAPVLALEGARMQKAQAGLRRVLPR